MTPWISDGTPHQWITPAGETTPWPQGVSVKNVPDMVGSGRPAGVPDCSAANDGCQTFYYTNQQSARLMFYHDHAWGITRLNVYAGEAAGYLITDPTEKKLVADGTDPGWPIRSRSSSRTGRSSRTARAARQSRTRPGMHPAGAAKGNLWYHHVYMPAQNPGDPSGMSAYGRWMYGPWFWPPATAAARADRQPVLQTRAATSTTRRHGSTRPTPFCEPEQIPGTPNISRRHGAVQRHADRQRDGLPEDDLDPKSYRFRILNAANDRFWNCSGTSPTRRPALLSEVALKPAEVAAAQTDPNVVPTPDTTHQPRRARAGSRSATRAGSCRPRRSSSHQPTTWITDPTRFDVGNVDKHSLLLAPAERAT